MRTGAFSNVTADRFVDLSATGDANAVLGIEGYADAGITPTFSNNSKASMDVTLDSNEDVEFDVGDNDSWELVPVTFGLSAGGSIDVALRDGGNAGTDSDIEITATNLDGFSFEGTRNFKIPASSTVKEIEPTVTATGNSGKYEFELENKGSATVTLTEIGVVETSNSGAVKVGGKNNDDIFINVNTGSSIVNNVITIGGSRVPLSTNVDLAPGSSNAIKFEFDRFRDSSDNNADMKNDDVKIDVAFSDGSSTTLDLCVNGDCSFDNGGDGSDGGDGGGTGPVVNNFTAQSNKVPGSTDEVQIDWDVEDQGGTALDQVVIDVTGDVTDQKTIDVSGTTANGSTTYDSSNNPSGNANITVSNVDGDQATESTTY